MGSNLVYICGRRLAGLMLVINMTELARQKKNMLEVVVVTPKIINYLKKRTRADRKGGTEMS